MKKSIFLCSVLALAGFGLGSCSSEQDAPVANADGPVTITARMPGNVVSRDYSDGSKATTLHYAVYAENTQTPVFTSEKATDPRATYNNDLTFSLSLNLVKGQSYDLVFWADCGEGSPYTFRPELQSVTVSYAGILSNDENRDAFFSCEKGLTVTGAMKKEIKLYRPFAQLNIGTNDIPVASAAGITVGKTAVTVKDVYSKLNLFDGRAADAADVTFGAAALPSGEDFPVNGYTYLSMNYVLTGSQIIGSDVNQAQKETKDITISVQKESGEEINSFTVSAVPFQRNYRTNVFGALLTSTVDYEIEIVPDYNKPDNDKEVSDPWDGTTKKAPQKNAEGKYEISSAAEFAGFNDMMTSPANFAGETFVLTSSIDMGGHKFTGIGANNKSFNGTFDGNGHTISNFHTTDDTETQPQYATALVPSLRGTVKNLVVENVKVGNYFKGNTYGNIVGVIAGYNNGTIENVTVCNCEVYGFGKVGGLVGMDESVDNGRYINCRVENTKILGTYNSAQLVGLAHNDLDLSSCSVAGNAIECGHYADQEWIKVGPTLAYDKAQNQRPAKMVEGYFVNLGMYFTTGAKYYNRYDVLNREGYRISVDGADMEIDGYPVNDLREPVTLPAGVRPVNNAEGFYVNGSEDYYVTSANGLAAYNAYWNANKASNTALYGRTVNIMADIDATGITWNPPFDSPGSNALNGFKINGNGHIISGLSLNGGLIGGQVNGSNPGTEPCTISNLTFKNCKSTGAYHVGIIGTQIYGDIVLENVHVIGCEVEGTCNVGGMLGRTMTEGKNATASFKGCTVTGTTVRAKGAEGCDPTGASIFVGCGVNFGGFTSTISFDGACLESGNTISNAEGLVGGTWWASATFADGAWSAEAK